MAYVLAVFFLPPLLVFGIYHLAIWFDVAGIARMSFWRRVAIASAAAHVVLAAGFFAFSWVDYQANRSVVAAGLPFDAFLFNRSAFWRIMPVFDTLPTLLLLGIFATLDRLSIGFGPIVALTIVVVFAAGTFQWYWVGGGLGALFDHLWSGLKTQDDDDDLDWL